MSPTYYNSQSLLLIDTKNTDFKKITKRVEALYSNHYNEKDMMTFNFNISKKTEQIINKIVVLPGKSAYPTRLNEEIVYRLAYTLADPFYDDFLERIK